MTYMTNTRTSPYGTWPTPITSNLIIADNISLDELKLHPTGTYWIERRPDEQGRCVIVKHANGQNHDLISKPFSARSRVHEYGGGVYCVTNHGVYFVNDKDQNIYFSSAVQPPVAITHTTDCCYADLQFDELQQRLICIQQSNNPELSEAENTLISIDLNSHDVFTLHSGNDFYASPRLSPCGTKLSWLCWNHPDMPWDKTILLWLRSTGTNLSKPGTFNTLNLMMCQYFNLSGHLIIISILFQI